MFADLSNSRYSYAAGHEAATRHGGIVVSDRADLNRVANTVFRIRGEKRDYHYVWRSGPHGYEWQLIPA